MKKKYNFKRLLGYIPILLVAVIWLSGSSVYAGGPTPATIASGTLYIPGGTNDIDIPTYGWVVPCGVTSITVEMWGGGGAGGGDSNNGAPSGCGGEAGEYVTATYAVTPGETLTLSIGEGGSGGSGAGGNGGNTTITGSTSGLLGTANGGAGGAIECWPFGVGEAGDNASGSDGGIGGLGGANHTDGQAGTAPGGGGGGANDNGGGSRSGGDGGNGGIIISYGSASAGVDQALAVCDLSTTLSATAAPANTIGTWTSSPAGAVFSDVNDPNATVTGLSQDVTYSFTWTISDNGGTGCTTSEDNVIILTRGPDATAGPDQSLCAGSYTLAGNEAEAGFTGTWTIVSEPSPGDISIADPSLYNSGITSTMSSGECATLQWTVTGACTNSDQVEICFPVICNDDPCGAEDASYTLPLNSSCSSTTFSAAITTDVSETTNPDRPGCGGFGGGSFDDGQDIWYSVGPVPADGIINFDVQLTGNGGDPSGQAAAAIYEPGAGCHDLIQVSCHVAGSNGGTMTISESGLTPGETIFIRVWDNDDYAATFNYTQDVTICAYTSTNNGDILPGDNNITCGTSYDFYDSGGSTGAYANNQLETYTICPPVSDPQEYVSVTFSSFAMATSLDHMIVLNGSAGNAPIIGDFSFGTPTYTSTATDGCLTFIFMSSPSNVAAGWEATVSCVADDPTNDDNHDTGTCNEQNCLGGCMRTLCGIPATVGFQGDGYGTQELNESNDGCLQGGENCSNWFYINPTSPGDLSLNMFVNTGQDQDFILWEAFGSELQCPVETGAEPLLCNYSAVSTQGTGFNDALTGTNAAYEPSLQISQDDIDQGIYYIIDVLTYNNGGACPQPDVQITFGGSAGLGCETPVSLGLDIVDLNGYNDDRRNIISWDIEDDTDVAYYIVEKSDNGNDWKYLTSEYSVNSTVGHTYQVVDSDPFSPFTYYRIQQVDYDGVVEYSHAIAVRKGDIEEDFVSPLFPNPANTKFYFNYAGKDFNSPVSVTVFDHLGKVLYYSKYEKFNNYMAFEVDATFLNKGIYNVKIEQNDTFQMQKISIIK